LALILQVAPSLPAAVAVARPSLELPVAEESVVVPLVVPKDKPAPTQPQTPVAVAVAAE
jgi:hypothetical protein